MNRTGIVYEPPKPKTFIPKTMIWMSSFKSKENRKKRKLLSKRHVEGLVIETRED